MELSHFNFPSFQFFIFPYYMPLKNKDERKEYDRKRYELKLMREGKTPPPQKQYKNIDDELKAEKERLQFRKQMNDEINEVEKKTGKGVHPRREKPLSFNMLEIPKPKPFYQMNKLSIDMGEMPDIEGIPDEERYKKYTELNNTKYMLLNGNINKWIVKVKNRKHRYDETAKYITDLLQEQDPALMDRIIKGIMWDVIQYGLMDGEPNEDAIMDFIDEIMGIE